MEDEARHFYRAAIDQITADAAVRQLLGDLAAEEDRHHQTAVAIERATGDLRGEGARGCEGAAAVSCSRSCSNPAWPG